MTARDGMRPPAAPVRRAAAVCASILLAGGTAAAQGCDGAQADMNACAEKAFTAADRRLQAAYDDISSRLKTDAEASRLLKEAQRAWLKFRDTECAFGPSGVAGGSVYPMIVAMCRESLTEARVRQLQYYQDCKEGDMSCPVPPRSK